MDTLVQQACCFSGMHAQRGSVLLDSDPPLRLLFHLSSGLSSLSPNSGSLIYEAQVLSWPRVAQLATAQEGGNDGGLLLRGCSGSVAMCKKLNCSSFPSVPWRRPLVRQAILSRNAHHRHSKYCLFAYLFLPLDHLG